MTSQPEHAGPLSSSYWPASTAEQVKESTVTSLLLDAQRQSPGKVALVAGAPDPSERRRWTYAELAEQAERVARALLERFEPGERVAVWAPNAPEWVLLELGAAMAGVVLVTLNPVLRPREIAYALRQSRSSGLFVVPEIRGNPTAPVVEELRHELPNLREVESLAGWEAFLASAGSASTAGPLPEVAAGDPAQIQYTSGTTGFPKGALLSHRGITNNASFCAQRLEVTGDDIWVNPMPLFHTGGCVLAVLGAIAANATQVLVPFFDPGLVLELAE
ncbi:MAG: AMP-binding protein, partial [Acidimicrobiales bacterium]